MSEPALRCSDLGVDYPGRARALHGVRLELYPGSLVALLGPNGAGKSTLLRALAGQRRPDRGTVCLAGGGRPDELAARRRARRIAYLPQRVAETGYTVREVVALGRFAHGPGRFFEDASDRRAISEAMELLDLLPLSVRSEVTLSGGERRRVQIARALCQQAPILLLDEPTSGLDPAHQIDVLGRLSELVRARGIAALVAMHALNLAARFADELVLLRDGWMLARGSPGQVFRREVLADAYRVDFHVARIERTGALFAVPVDRRRGR